MDPYARLREWLAAAEATEPRVADAMQLATVDAGGRPSVRTVLLKEVRDDGLVFFTNYRSRKAAALDATGRAAVCLHWKTRVQQVTADGMTERLDDAASDAYWLTRDRGSQVGAWASRQSAALSSMDALHAAVATVEARFSGRDVPRPPFWGGYLLRVERWEFWQGRADRLHLREELTRGPGGDWALRLLYP